MDQIRFEKTEDIVIPTERRMIRGKPSTLLIVALVVAMAWIAALSLSARPRGFSRGVDPGPIKGRWINPTYTSECSPTLQRVCAEFIDEEDFSPLTGSFCCVKVSELSLGLWSSCELRFLDPPRED